MGSDAGQLSAIHLSTMPDIHHRHNYGRVLDLAHHPVDPNPVTPQRRKGRSREHLALAAWIRQWSDPFIHEIKEAPRNRTIELG